MKPPRHRYPKPKNTALARLAYRVARWLPLCTMGRLWDTQKEVHYAEQAYDALYHEMQELMKERTVAVNPFPVMSVTADNFNDREPIVSIEFRPLRCAVPVVPGELVNPSKVADHLIHDAARDLARTVTNDLADVIEQITRMRLRVAPFQPVVRPVAGDRSW